MANAESRLTRLIAFAGTAARRRATPQTLCRQTPAPSAAPVKTKATDQMKLGAVMFVVCLFGACPAAFVSDNDLIRALLVGGMIVGMIVGAVMYFAGS